MHSKHVGEWWLLKEKWTNLLFWHILTGKWTFLSIFEVHIISKESEKSKEIFCVKNETFWEIGMGNPIFLGNLSWKNRNFWTRFHDPQISNQFDHWRPCRVFPRVKIKTGSFFREVSSKNVMRIWDDWQYNIILVQLHIGSLIRGYKCKKILR